MFRLYHGTKMYATARRRRLLSVSSRLLSANGLFIPICLFLFLVVISTGSLFGQNMDEGFRMLESGEYHDAKSFFQEVLEKNSENKTANICFGRALGLSGSPAEALALFYQLSERHPGDQEVNLNLAEAYLWNDNASEASQLYSAIIDSDPSSVSGHIGLANSQAKMRDYQAALNTLDNSYIKNSGLVYIDELRNSIRLGYADALIKKDSYADAKSQYELIMNSDSDNIPALIGLTNVSYLLDKKRDCLDYATQALEFSPEGQPSDNVVANLIQAHIWNHQYGEATQLIRATYTTEQQKSYYHRYMARMAIQRRSYSPALSHYNELLTRDADDIEAWAGRTDALLALDSIVPAMKTIDAGIDLHPQSTDLGRLKHKSYRKLAPTLLTDTKYSRDSGQDQSVDISVNPIIPVSQSIALLADLGIRNVYNQLADTDLILSRYSGGIRFKLLANTTLTAIGGISQINDQENDPSLVNYDINGHTKQGPHEIKLGFRRSFQDYNFTLLSDRISQRQLYADYSVSNVKGLGLFTQYVYSQLSDQNTNHLVYASVYKALKRRPFIKLGASVQYITFDISESVPYFSPDQFWAQELFIDIVRTPDLLKAQGVTYLITGAIGSQQIDDMSASLTYRAQLKLGYLFDSGIHIELYGLHTNVASSNASGFTFSQVGLSTKWLFKQGPLFRVD